jgi:hypothetical protein
LGAASVVGGHLSVATSTAIHAAIALAAGSIAASVVARLAAVVAVLGDDLESAGLFVVADWHRVYLF